MRSAPRLRPLVAPSSSAPAHPKAVVFDLGKVLLDFDFHKSSWRLAEACRAPTPTRQAALLELFGHSPQPTGLLDRWGGRSLVEQMERGQLSSRQFYQLVCELSGLQVDYPTFAQLYADIFTPIAPLIAQQQLLAAAGWPTYLLSNCSALHIDDCRRRHAFMGSFAGLCLSYEVCSFKPDPEIYAAAEQLTGCSGPDLVFIDDKEENAAAAAARGWQAIHHTSVAGTLQQLQALGLPVVDAAGASPLNPVLWVPGTADCNILIEVDPSYRSPSGSCPGGTTVDAQLGPIPPFAGTELYCLAEYLGPNNNTAAGAPDGGAQPGLFNQPGVRTSLNDSVAGTPAYLQGWYDAFASKGYDMGPDSDNFAVACWDWRLTPNTTAAGAAETEAWDVRATQAIERLYNASGEPVYLMGASNGALFIKALLDSKPQEWKDRYVAGFVGIAPGIGGLNQCLLGILLGLDSSAPNLTLPLAPIVSHWPLLYYCLPQPALWGRQQPMATSTADPSNPVQYYAADLRRFFSEELRLPAAAAMLDRFAAPNSTWAQPPGVDTLLIHGFGIPTFGDVSSSAFAQGLPLQSFDAANPMATFGATNLGDGWIDTFAAAAPEVAGWATSDLCHTLESLSVTDPSAAANFPTSSLLFKLGGSPAAHYNLWADPASTSVAAVLAFVTRPEPVPRPGC
ncbi:haloacid dehalogenase [Chlorella sorokiniana]|uniref:Haloacid dehalogenase n=1 Tax=Chlorella sorokiniana TaxID=3076 RepID=A0A2P6U1G1_CHLSO|nr:haloacid dehalogenase [Chlorella sorokiniana]|eukprot:PRW60139.1 haloacid dehalogenase [Chlorella sorokiniana]